VKPVSLSSPPPAAGESVGSFPGEVEVCRQFAPRLRAIALRHLKDRSQADDVVQEVLTSVVLALREGRIESPELVGPYALSACRRRIADTHRTEARRSALREELGGLTVSALTEPPCVEEKRVDIERLVRALGPLSGRERQVMNETFSSERSAEEIAESIGTTPGHVRVLRHRALAKMRAALGWQEES
jgi:RNA polymerase sigma-70 factor, ECF subfamily